MKCKCDFVCYACADKEMNKEIPDLNSSLLEPCKFTSIVDVDKIDDDTEDEILGNHVPEFCPYAKHNESRWCLVDYIAY